MFHPNLTLSPPGMAKVIVPQHLWIFHWDLRTKWWIGENIIELIVSPARGDPQFAVQNFHFFRPIPRLINTFLCTVDTVFETVKVVDVTVPVAIHDHIHAGSLAEVAIHIESKKT